MPIYTCSQSCYPRLCLVLYMYRLCWMYCDGANYRPTTGSRHQSTWHSIGQNREVNNEHKIHIIYLQVRRDYEDLPETSHGENSRNGAGVPDIVVSYHDSYAEIDAAGSDANNADQVTINNNNNNNCPKLIGKRPHCRIVAPRGGECIRPSGALNRHISLQ